MSGASFRLCTGVPAWAFVCVVSLASWLFFNGVCARAVRCPWPCVRRPWPLDACSLVWCLVCGTCGLRGLLRRVHRCACFVCSGLGPLMLVHGCVRLVCGVCGACCPLQRVHQCTFSCVVRALSLASWPHWGLLHVFQLPITALTRVRLGLRLPPSKIVLSTALTLQMLAQVLVHLRVVYSLDGQLNHQMDQITMGLRASFPVARFAAIVPRLRRNVPYEVKVRLSRAIGCRAQLPEGTKAFFGGHARGTAFQLRDGRGFLVCLRTACFARHLFVHSPATLFCSS